MVSPSDEATQGTKEFTLDANGSGAEEPSKPDANDYSRFEDVADSDSDDNSEKVPSLESSSPAMSLTEATNLANIMKDVGNTSFKGGLIKEALESYSEAANALTKLGEDDQKKEDVKSLLISLNGNKAMCYVKQAEWSLAKASASAVLKIDANNVKALYRRGLAHHKLAALDEAKSDLSKALSLQSDNVAVKKELVEVEKSLREYAKRERAAFGSMFGGKSMYQDKEAERLAKRRKEEEKEAKLRDDWTKDKMARRSRKEDELSFEDFKKDVEKKEKEKEKEKADEERKRRDAARKASKPATGSKKPAKPATTSESDEENDEDLKELIKGYKQTSDGRKTSYFNNELDSKTKELIGDIAPKPIASPSATAAAQPPAAAEVVGSAWNSAGTFEEKDMTNWAKEKLTEVLRNTKYTKEAVGDSVLTGAIIVEITKVKSLTGDAEIIASRGKRRHLFDFAAELEWECTLTAFALSHGTGDSQDKKFKGTLKVTDISPDSDAEIAVTTKKAIPPEHRERVNESTQKGLVNALKAQIDAFNKEYQLM